MNKRFAGTVATLAASIACLSACGASTTPVASVDGGKTAPISTPAAPAGPKQTVSQGQAVQSAKDYLKNVGGFSRKGLIGQLTTEEGFSTADATYGVDNSGANWTAEADQSAAQYMSSVGGFSAKSLTEQLTSEEGFTAAQAAAGVKSVGL